MRSTHYLTIIIAFMLLKLNYFPEFSWEFVFSPAIIWLVGKTLRFLFKALIKGIIVGIIQFFKNNKTSK